MQAHGTDHSADAVDAWWLSLGPPHADRTAQRLSAPATSRLHATVLLTPLR